MNRNGPQGGVMHIKEREIVLLIIKKRYLFTYIQIRGVMCNILKFNVII